MRRSSLKLVLASTLPLAISACSNPDDNTVEVNTRNTFSTVQECVDQKFPVDICSDAYMNALADHRRIAPTYDDAASCEADFVPGYCQPNSDGKFTPKLGGFELGISGRLPKDQVAAAQAQANNGSANNSGGSGGGFGGNGFLTGLLIGNLLSSNSGSSQYYSQPIYQTRDSRGAYQSSTLSRQIDDGKTFSRSNQARSSSSGSYSSDTLARNLGSGSVSSSVSRGGFGSQATARSGWGGKSGGFSSGG